MKDIVDKALKDWQIAKIQATQCRIEGLDEFYAYNIVAKRLFYEYWLREAKDVEMAGKVSS